MLRLRAISREIQRAIGYNGSVRRGSRGLHLDYAALHARYMAGESGVAIATELGIDFTGLYASWKRRGYPMRSTREAARLICQQRPDRRELIRHAQAARRGTPYPMSTRVKRAQTREARGIGISDNERRLGERLREAGIAFRQQAAIGPYNVDFLIGDLALDIDGGGHNPGVRANRPARTAFIEAQGFRCVAVETRRKGWEGVALRHANTGEKSLTQLG
jgi:very-short-patch-repair endonuclease